MCGSLCDARQLFCCCFLFVCCCFLLLFFELRYSLGGQCFLLSFFFSFLFFSFFSFFLFFLIKGDFCMSGNVKL